jgi:hypothetical protein
MTRLLWVVALVATAGCPDLTGEDTKDDVEEDGVEIDVGQDDQCSIAEFESQCHAKCAFAATACTLSGFGQRCYRYQCTWAFGGCAGSCVGTCGWIDPLNPDNCSQ